MGIFSIELLENLDRGAILKTQLLLFWDGDMF